MINTKPQLRDYQQELIDRTRQALARGIRRVIMQSHVGSGKTVMASEIIRLALEKDIKHRILFIAPRRQLIYQTIETLDDFGIGAGMIMAGESRSAMRRVQVASFDTITSRVANGRMGLPEADLVMVDEAHMCMTPARLKILSEYKRVIGLTATPALANGKGMGAFYQEIVESLTMGEMVERGYLVPMRYFIGEAADVSQIKLNADGEYVESQLAEVTDTPKLIGDIYKNWKRIASDRTTLIFAINRKHARHIHDEFLSHGVSSEYIDGDTPPEERERIRKQVESGETQVIINIGVMVAGVNWPRISCVIIARQMRNIANWIQCIGRGSRLHPTKKDCLARDTLVLTDKGLVKIQDVTLYHRLWDGVSWVTHDGAVCKGVSNTIEYSGLIATPDHEVMTDEGWKKFSEAAYRRLRIIDSGLGRSPIRIGENNFTKNRGEKRQANGGSRLFKMWQRVYDSLSQYTQKRESKALPGMQSSKEDKSSIMDIQEVSSANGQMHKPKKPSLRKIWGKGNRISFRFCKCSGAVGNGESWNTKQHDISARQDKQQWALRAWQSEMVNTGSKSEQYSLFGWIKKKSIYKFSREISAYQICRFNAKQTYTYWFDRWSNNRQVSPEIIETKREVWDILNAGPLQRFTANGKLVHNCTVIYHGSNFDDLGMIDEPIEWSLDDKTTIRERKQKAQKEAKEPKDITCADCGTVFKSRRICPNCGHEMIGKGEAIPVHEADLQEITKPKPADKAAWFAQLLHYSRQKGYSDGWAAHKFQAKFGHWPYKKAGVKPEAPGPEVLGWLKHLAIKHAKARAA